MEVGPLPIGGLKVIDFHAHFPYGWRRQYPSDSIARYAAQRRRRMALEWDMDEPDYDWSNADRSEVAARWAAEVERHGLERVVVMTGGGNDPLAETVRERPDRFSGFAHHPPDAPGALDELRRAVEELGLVGYKVIAPMVGVPLDDRSLAPLWSYLEEKRLPVVIHFGLLGTGGGVVHHPLINPLVLAPVAARYQGVRFVVPHFGCGYWKELLQLCWAYPNVYVDTSGSNQWTRWMPYPLDLESLFRKAYETVGPRRIVFGSDSSWFPRGFAYRYLQDQVRACRWLGMKEEDLRDIFHDNAARLLGLLPE